MQKKMSDKTLVIVFGTGTCALGQIRCAHDAGYDCINVVGKTPNRFSANSRSHRTQRPRFRPAGPRYKKLQGRLRPAGH